jgi:hypothetical protein
MTDDWRQLSDIKIATRNFGDLTVSELTDKIAASVDFSEVISLISDATAALRSTSESLKSTAERVDALLAGWIERQRFLSSLQRPSCARRPP